MTICCPSPQLFTVVHRLFGVDLHDYYDVYRQVAKDRKLLLIDHNANWKKVLQADAARFNKLVPDGIHPNALGCETVILPQLLKSLDVGRDSMNVP